MKETTFENLKLGDVFKFNVNEKSSYIKISNKDLDRCIIKENSQQILGIKGEVNNKVYKINENEFDIPSDEKINELKMFNKEIKCKIVNIIEEKKSEYIEKLEKKYPYMSKNESGKYEGIKKPIKNILLLIFTFFMVLFISFNFNIFGLSENDFLLFLMFPISITFIGFMIYKIHYYCRLSETFNDVNNIDLDKNNVGELLKDIEFLKHVKLFRFNNINLEILYHLNCSPLVFSSNKVDKEKMKILTYFFNNEEILKFINKKGEFEYLRVLEKTTELEYEYNLKRKVNELY